MFGLTSLKCVKFGFTAIYAFRNVTNKLSLPVKAFDSGLKVIKKCQKKKSFLCTISIS